MSLAEATLAAEVTVRTLTEYLDSQLYPPGDLDLDGDVDLADLSQLLAHYGMDEGATYQDGDIDGDEDVDLDDLSALLANYGFGT